MDYLAGNVQLVIAIFAKFLPTNVLISFPAFLSAFNFAAKSKKYLISSGVY